MTNPPKLDMPPQDPLSEQRVLAALMRNESLCEDVAEIICLDDFFFSANQTIYAVIQSLRSAKSPTDAASVYAELVRRGQSKDVQSVYLADILDADPIGAFWQYSATQVKEQSIRRRIIHTCSEIIRDSYSTGCTVDELMQTYERDIFAVAKGIGTKDDPVRLSQAYDDVLQEIDRRGRGEGARPISTGYDALDGVLGGFRGGELTIIAARPSVGKTSLALNLALNALTQHNTDTLFFSQEMNRSELVQRTIAIRAEVPLYAIRGNRPLRDQEPSSITGMMTSPLASELWIDDRSSLTAQQIASRVREWQRKHNVKLIFIDYLQRMNHGNTKGDSYSRQVGESAKALKTLARDTNLPVICLAQLNRQSESRPDAKPKLSDLRDSGEIEQEADNVLLLHPEPLTSENRERQPITVLVEKQRNGPVSDIRLEHVRQFTKFVAGRNDYGI